jgi:hypothetical protein
MHLDRQVPRRMARWDCTTARSHREYPVNSRSEHSVKRPQLAHLCADSKHGHGFHLRLGAAARVYRQCLSLLCTFPELTPIATHVSGLFAREQLADWYPKMCRPGVRAMVSCLDRCLACICICDRASCRPRDVPECAFGWRGAAKVCGHVKPVCTVLLFTFQAG